MNMGVAAPAAESAVDVLAIVAGARVPRRSTGEPADYLYDDSADVTRILDISTISAVASTEGDLPLNPNFASLHYKRMGGHAQPRPVFKLLLPGVWHEVTQPRGAAAYAISNAGTLTVKRTARGVKTTDVRVTGLNDNPGEFIRRPAVFPLAPAGAVLSGDGLKTSPATSVSGYDLHIEPGLWVSPDGERGTMVAGLTRGLTIRFGGARAYATLVANLLDRRQRRQAERQ
jgi:hypothetical protein